jgi:germination protein M
MRSAAAKGSLLALVVLAAGCGGSEEQATNEPAAPPLPAPATTETRPADTEVRPVAVYFVRDSRLGAANRLVTSTPAIGRAALEQLLAGPTEAERAAGLASDIPSGTELTRLAITEHGMAEVELSNPLDEPGMAQVVFTLTQFPTVKHVLLEGERHYPGDFEHVLPAILLESPAPGATVSSPLTLRGTANTFEATFMVELRSQQGKPLYKDFVTATSGNGTRGIFEKTIDFAVGREQPGTLVVYENSAEDGSVVNEVEIPVTIRP